MVIRRYCCKTTIVFPNNPFQAEEWIRQANIRYKNILQKSPESLYNAANNTYEQNQCIICLLSFTEGQSIRRLKCQHIFHKDCIEQWIKIKINKIPKCPTCNTGLTKEQPNGYVESNLRSSHNGSLNHGSPIPNIPESSNNDRHNEEFSGDIYNQ